MGLGPPDLRMAALRGEPSYVWRAGQERRLQMIREGAGPALSGVVLDNGCGVGAFLEKLSASASRSLGVELDTARAKAAADAVPNAIVARAAGEALPFPSTSIDLVLSHEVLEHVDDDRLAVADMVRVLRPSGRLIVFVPNRGYPFETHGVYWRGRYHFGNIPLVGYLPTSLRNRLAPHVRAYRSRDVAGLFVGLPARIVSRTIIFGAYDNVIARWPRLGRGLRAVLQALERTPLRAFGLSHVWVVEKETRD